MSEIADSLAHYLVQLGIESTVAFSVDTNKLYVLLRYNFGLKPCPETYMGHVVIKKVVKVSHAINLDC